MVYMLLGTGFEETEAIVPFDLMRRAGIEIRTAGINGKMIRSSHGVEIAADIGLADVDLSLAEMIVIPGGLGGVASIRASQEALDILKSAWKQGKYVAAICAGPTVLADLGIIGSRQATCYPGCESGMGDARMIANAACVQDGKLITGTSAGCAIPFGLKLIEALKGKPAADSVAKQIVIR